MSSAWLRAILRAVLPPGEAIDPAEHRRVTQTSSVALLETHGESTPRRELSQSWLSSDAFCQAGKRLFVHRSHEAFLVGDHSIAIKVGEAAIERLHANSRVGFDDRIHLVRLALTDQILDRRRAQHDLDRGATTSAELR